MLVRNRSLVVILGESVTGLLVALLLAVIGLNLASGCGQGGECLRLADITLAHPADAALGSVLAAAER